MRALERLTRWARALKRDVVALWIAARDRRTPMAARVVAMAVAAYALSPIDLVPDFIPVLGQLDELVILPLGVALALRLIPPALAAEFRAAAAQRTMRPRSRVAAVVIVGVWLATAALAAAWLLPSAAQPRQQRAQLGGLDRLLQNVEARRDEPLPQVGHPIGGDDHARHRAA